MVIALRKLSVLSRKTMSAEIVVTGRADTVSSPIPERQNQPTELRIVRVHCTALAHRHVMWRIEGAGADIPPGSRKAGFSVYRIAGSQRVAVVFDKPKMMLITEFLDDRQVKGISQGMRNHHRLRFLGKRVFQTAYIDIVLRNRDIEENGNHPILEHGGHRSRKTAGHRDNLISSFNLSFSELSCRKRHKRKEIRRRSGIHQIGVLYANPLRKLLLKFVCKTSRCEPKI